MQDNKGLNSSSCSMTLAFRRCSESLDVFHALYMSYTLSYTNCYKFFFYFTPAPLYQSTIQGNRANCFPKKLAAARDRSVDALF